MRLIQRLVLIWRIYRAFMGTESGAAEELLKSPSWRYRDQIDLKRVEERRLLQFG